MSRRRVEGVVISMCFHDCMLCSGGISHFLNKTEPCNFVDLILCYECQLRHTWNDDLQALAFMLAQSKTPHNYMECSECHYLEAMQDAYRKEIHETTSA